MPNNNSQILLKKKIFLNRKKIKAIMAQTETSEATVFQALCYALNSAKGLEIRKLALEQYGAVMHLTYERPMTENDIKNTILV